MPPRIDLGLFFLRLTGSLLLLYVHGLPKVLHFSEELTRIEDPFGFGPYASLIPAISISRPNLAAKASKIDTTTRAPSSDLLFPRRRRKTCGGIRIPVCTCIAFVCVVYL